MAFVFLKDGENMMALFVRTGDTLDMGNLPIETQPLPGLFNELDKKSCLRLASVQGLISRRAQQPSQ